jgi:hypothetical protein
LVFFSLKNKGQDKLSYIQELPKITIFNDKLLKEYNYSFYGYPKNVKDGFLSHGTYNLHNERDNIIFNLLDIDKHIDSDAVAGYSGSGVFLNIKNTKEVYLVGLVIRAEEGIPHFEIIDLEKVNEKINKVLTEQNLPLLHDEVRKKEQSDNEITETIELENGKSFNIELVKVELEDKVLYVGKYPVTFEEYNSYCKDIDKSFTFLKGYEDEPIGKISWDDAYQYCQWLGSKIDKECNLINSKNWKIISLNHHIKVDENISEWCEDGNENERKLKMGSHFELVDMKLKTLKISFRYNIIN